MARGAAPKKSGVAAPTAGGKKKDMKALDNASSTQPAASVNLSRTPGKVANGRASAPETLPGKPDGKSRRGDETLPGRTRVAKWINAKARKAQRRASGR